MFFCAKSGCITNVRQRSEIMEIFCKFFLLVQKLQILPCHLQKRTLCDTFLFGNEMRPDDLFIF